MSDRPLALPYFGVLPTSPFSGLAASVFSSWVEGLAGHIRPATILAGPASRVAPHSCPRRRDGANCRGLVSKLHSGRKHALGAASIAAVQLGVLVMVTVIDQPHILPAIVGIGAVDMVDLLMRPAAVIPVRRSREP
jgi:hypothetical protein